MEFSGREIKDILISTLVIGFSFAWVTRDNPDYLRFNFVEVFIIMLFAVGSAFILHELAHKLSAQNFGCYAEYKMWETGLILAFFMAVSPLKIVFAAPGAVYIAPGRFGLTKKQDLIISSAGIVTNIALAIIFSVIARILPFGFASIAFSVAAMVNSWIALFNLIPIPPLDGSKVIRWNFGVWLALGAAAFLAWNGL